MSMLKCCKCICCLIKCSKYLYFVKKLVCTATIALIIGAAIMSLCDKKTCKKLLEKVKAVM